MVLLDEKKAMLIEECRINGRTQAEAARKVRISRHTAGRVLDQFENELACIIGPNSKFSPSYVRDLIVRLLGNAKAVRESMAA